MRPGSNGSIATLEVASPGRVWVVVARPLGSTSTTVMPLIVAAARRNAGTADMGNLLRDDR
jgi:hypothetical protein